MTKLTSSDYIPDFIIDIFEPSIIIFIFFFVILHPRMPSLAIAAFMMAKCLFISHLCGPSGIPASIVVIFDMSAPEQDIIIADAGLNTKAVATSINAKTEYFILNLRTKKTGAIANLKLNSPERLCSKQLPTRERAQLHIGERDSPFRMYVLTKT